MRRRTALAGGWLATTALATAVCAVAVSLVTSDLTDPRRDALAVAELHSIEAAAGAEGAVAAPAERVDLDTAIDKVPSDVRASRTVVSGGGVVVATCPAPITLRSARPHPGAQVVVDDTLPGVIEVRFVRARTTEVHRLTCGPDGVEVATAVPEEVAAPAPPDTDRHTTDQPSTDESGSSTSSAPPARPAGDRDEHRTHDRRWWHDDRDRDDDARNRGDGERHDRDGGSNDGWRPWGDGDQGSDPDRSDDEDSEGQRRDRGPGGWDDGR